MGSKKIACHVLQLLQAFDEIEPTALENESLNEEHFDNIKPVRA